MSAGDVLEEAWDLYTRFFVRFVATAAVVFVVLDLLSAVFNAVRGSSALATAFWALVSVVLSVVGSFWVQGALVEAVRDVRDGRIDTTIGELYGRTQERLPALIGAGLVAGIAIGIGLLLLVVPGLYLLTRWCLLVPVIVLERRRAGEAFDRSWQLVRGHGLTVFGVIVVTIVTAALASAIVSGILGAILNDFFGTWLGGVVAHSITAPFVALAWTVMYYRLAGEEPTAAAASAEA